MSKKNLVLYLTNGCNLNCTYCFVKKDNIKVLDFDKYKKIIEKYKNDISSITFFGGEPLLCFDLISNIITYNRNNNYNYLYNINTNGLLLNDDIIKLIIDNKILVNASLDGNLLSNQNRFNKDKFDVVLSNIKKLINNDIEVVINYVITPNNIKYVFDSLVFFKDNYINNICLMINYDAKWDMNDILIYKEQLYKLFTIDFKDLVIYPIHNKISIISRNIEEHRCDFGNESIIVSQEGDLYPCISFIDDEYKNKDKYINTVDTSKCSNCTYKKYCFNNCMCRSKNGTNINCEIEKIYIDIAYKILNEYGIDIK